ncbi:hypothetical protein [Haloplanus pelagicus]|jgi:hypothetical protein|uniref:hypothetical protein n=1 Tax=Haloplanus pelagicus TaxID=2949995 RepID=UPI00203FFA1D|nr:hypothetical protein [Haloplanus sp. HW8-1]
MDAPEEVATDLRVAAVAAACTVLLPIVLRFGLGATVSPVPLLSPVAVYFGYVFLGRGETFGQPRPWIALILVVTVATALFVR